LKSGKKFCNLFTDLLNPTSNSIYQKIGYRKIGESKHFKLPEKGV
jgi:predicted GNAT family acetyltransferase